MNNKLSELLKKISFPENDFYYFTNAKIDKIVVSEKNKTWDIYLSNETIFPPQILDCFLDKIKAYTKDDNTYKIHIKSAKEDYSLVTEYYQNILYKLNNNHYYYNMLSDRLIKIDDTYYIEIYNKSEQDILNKKLELINQYFKDFGYKIKLTARMNENKRSDIKEEINNDFKVSDDILEKAKQVIKEKTYDKKEASYPRRKESSTKNTNPNILYGRMPKEIGKLTKLKDIISEENNITIEVNIFGIEPSNKKGFNSFSLKVTDFETSMRIRVFASSEEEYEDQLKKYKENMWIRVNGYIKNNTYYNDFVLNARGIEKIEVTQNEIIDESEEKRVELHTHTKMSQMDGVCDVKDLIKRAIKYGHPAIAITDHNAIQNFPEMYHHKDEIKLLYGVELSMIDDDIDLTFRSNNSNLLDNTYVVFDLETTGFNAGGGDSIIEIGAVKLKNGEIIDRFDKLINPKCKLSETIVNLTNITDEMLKDCPDEETVVKEFISWAKDLPMVAHNAKFDASFLEMAYYKYKLGTFTNPLLDTLQISRALDTDQSRHSLSTLVKRYEIPWDENAHHRGDYDAEATALIFDKMLKRLKSKKITKLDEVNSLVSKEDIHKFGELYHVSILVKNKVGLKNLFKLISLANTKYLYKVPRILRSSITSLREGLLIGSSCANGEIFRLARSKSEDEISDLMNFYDYIEVQPPEVYSYLIDLSDFKDDDDVKANIKKIIKVAKNKGKLVVATGDVHHLDKEDKIYRSIIVNQKVPGGGRHPLNRKEIKEIPSMHFRTTSEMLEDFNFLDKDLAKEIVITNTNKIANSIEDFEIIPDTKGIPFSPKFPNSQNEIRERVYKKAHELYGDPLPKIIESRIESELNGIIKGGFDTIYLIAQRLVEHSNQDGYTVGSRGSVGSSFVATMLNITEVNSLPAHYICPNCKKSIFEDEKGELLSKTYASGFDLPDKVCSCGTNFKKDGQDMPFATFLGFNADKVPDIDLNFSGDYQPKAHEYTKVLFGEDNVYRAGTIGTVAEKTAYGFVKGYFEDHNLPSVKPLEIERLSLGVTGVKRSTGQHPGGIVVVPDYKEIYDFTPFQYPADDTSAAWRTTHFNYHDIESCLLKLDILGHDNPTIFKMLEELTHITEDMIPMDDKDVMSLFSSPKALGVTKEQINCEVGCLALPEFTKFVMGIVLETKPTTFAELVKISGLSHGTDVWNGNAQDIVNQKIVPFKEVIGCRDDIMVYLLNHGVEALTAFKIMEFVRKGKASKDKEQWNEYKKILKENKIKDWFITSCGKIKYMFPKAHATAYITAAWRIGWFKINYPIEYYATFFSIKCFSFDLEVMEMGYAKIRERLNTLNEDRYSLSVKEQDLITTLEVAQEMTARGFSFSGIDLLKSDSKKFIIDEDHKTLIPPFRSIDGLGESVANNIIQERAKGEFISIEDLQKRCKISQTIIEKMRIMGILKKLPESSQLSLFDMI